MRKLLVLLLMCLAMPSFALAGGEKNVQSDEPKTVQEAADRFFAFFPVVVDTRSANEFRDNHIKGAVNLDWFDPYAFERFVAKTPKNKPLLVYSLVHWRGALMAQRLREAGFVNAIGLTGGMDAWIKAGYPVYSYTSGSEHPMSIEEYLAWSGQTRIVIEYKTLNADYEKALAITHELEMKYPALRSNTWKFSPEWPQRTKEQLEEVKDLQVIVSLVQSNPNLRKYYDGVPDMAVLEKDVVEALAAKTKAQAAKK